MIEYIEVRTQKELDKVLTRANVIPVCIGNGHFVITGSASVEAFDSASVEASDSASVEAGGSASVEASKLVAIYKHISATSKPKVTGGLVIEVRPPKTAKEWCDFYGVKIRWGLIILFKAVDDDYSTSRGRRAGILYTPGTKPKAPDWDEGENECGGGLHFSPSPSLARTFNSTATRYVACPIKFSEIVVHPDATYPHKIKAPRVYGKVYEVDLDGNRI